MKTSSSTPSPEDHLHAKSPLYAPHRFVARQYGAACAHYQKTGRRVRLWIWTRVFWTFWGGKMPSLTRAQWLDINKVH